MEKNVCGLNRSFSANINELVSANCSSGNKKFRKKMRNQRTNGPVDAHLRPETCLTRMVIYMYITPGQGQSNLWSQFLF